jgi:uncharacterized protein (TIGR02246 family)
MTHLRRMSLMAIVIFAACFAGCPRQSAQPAAPPDTRAADEAAIRALDAQFAKDAAAKDSAKIEALYMDDAVIFGSGLPAVVGKDNIDKAVERMLAGPPRQFAFSNVTVDVARSGDLAEDRGTGLVTITGKDGKPLTQSSEYVLVWKKQADGSWKIAADTSAVDR